MGNDLEQMRERSNEYNHEQCETKSFGAMEQIPLFGHVTFVVRQPVF